MDEALRQFWIQRLDALWHSGIPLAATMGARISRLDGHCLAVAAPLAPNVNHMGTAFGGALQALATLAGWGVTLIAAGREFDGHVVIRESRMRFMAPVASNLHARCEHPPADEQARFLRILAERGRARLELSVSVGGRGERARFDGQFVALSREGQRPDPRPL